MFTLNSRSFAVLFSAWLLPSVDLQAQSNAYRGLWVGEITLNAVNEVTVPLDENNVAKAPDPKVPTKTFDAANLRLILHVDATGHVSLLKDVAVLSRTGSTVYTENEMALVTNPQLYGEFPPQAATRIASAVFDFGDSKATEAVNKVVSAASEAARNSVSLGQSEVQATQQAKAAAMDVLTKANVFQSFDAFLTGPAKKASVKALANGTSSSAMMNQAILLRNSSFYQDARGVEMVNAIVAAIAAAPAGPAIPPSTLTPKEIAALNTASSFADISDNYDRFLAGQLFGDMIFAAANAAAGAAVAAPLKTITNFEGAAGSSPVTVTCASHGLGVNDEISIISSAVGAYNGLRKVTAVVDANKFTIQMPYVGGNAITGYQAYTQVAPLVVYAPAHGLSDGDIVTISGAGETNYNQTLPVTVLDIDTFSIATEFVSDPAQKGKYSVLGGAITGYEGAASGASGVKIYSPAHGLPNGQEIEIINSDKASYNGTKTITLIDSDSFAIDQAFDGNPAGKGSWVIRMPVVGYAPPSPLETEVVSAAHGLKTGDRIVISGSAKVTYNGEKTIRVTSPNTFVIAADWQDASGNPAVKGSWTPVTSGQWRRVLPLRTAVNNNVKVNDARTEALKIQVVAYGDSRSTDAINTVLAAVIASAAGAESSSAPAISADAEAAGLETLSTAVQRYAQPSSRPTPDYNAFVTSSEFLGSAETAAAAAAAGAKFEKDNNVLATNQSILDKATQQAINSLNSVYGAAARAVRADLPLTGAFGPGSQNLEGILVLPANHPTNPFRHRRHPDHAVGFDITRKLKFKFDGSNGDPLSPTGFGVESISGIYEEEIFGLHKPLGPNQDVGLKVKGTFKLNRISLIDTLNGR